MIILYSKISQHFHDDLIKKYLNYFDADFQKKNSNYRRWQDSQSSLVGRLMLIEGLKEYGILTDEINKLKYNKFGKPFLNDNLIFFNISHSEDIVVCAVNKEFEVGIDIEKIIKIEINDFKNYMSDFEWLKILTSDYKLKDFYKYWTQKEAVLKAYGRGLTVPLTSFEVNNMHSIIDNHIFSVSEIHIADNYICNLAYKLNANNKTNVKIKEVFF